MTPNEILDEVIHRPLVLYHDDPDRLERLLRQALGKYQDKAGAILEQWGDEGSFEIPPHFHAVAGCSDSERRYMPWRWGKAEKEVVTNTDEFGVETVEIIPVKTIDLIIGRKHVAPYCLYYFADLRHWPGDEELPPDCGVLTADYLEALLNVVNIERQREAYLSMDMVQAAQELQNVSELRQRITEIETIMEENKALIPPASQF
ncbi:MAG: hypothetical protein IJU76_14280 [Desulfovibrionaceae bacterium]|nr:hypothetical protein [Desulfovibrionaceae bacterium]